MMGIYFGDTTDKELIEELQQRGYMGALMNKDKERELFEAWMPYKLKREPDGDNYASEAIQFAFEAFQHGIKLKDANTALAVSEATAIQKAYYEQVMKDGEARIKKLVDEISEAKQAISAMHIAMTQQAEALAQHDEAISLEAYLSEW